ncbi:MAG: family 20 glycosylhydrolase [Acidobacteriaceae bacterium]|nr:family 20 glycosylhydrolase [Acidobacteriaceae bacterium]
MRSLNAKVVIFAGHQFRRDKLENLNQLKFRLVPILASVSLVASFAQSPNGPLQKLQLMPWPANIAMGSGALAIQTGFSISLSGAGASDPRVVAAADRVFPRLSLETGIPIPSHIEKNSPNSTLNIIVESKDHRAPQRLGDDESYSLEIANGRARLSANEPLGAVRGVETFLQLVQQNGSSSAAPSSNPGFSAAAVTIHDAPRFGWRGLSLDVSRHFIGVEGVERTLDGMAAVKLNVLHWHLSDDQGFRVESKKLPRLTKLGSDGLYYTQAQIREVLVYARERGVRIVPEFDMPGHATSWLAGYPNLGVGAGPYQIAPGYGILGDLIDPTKESTYRFMNTFIGEMAKLFPDEYFHIGGDEVNPKEWNDSPRVQAFMRKHNLADAKALQSYFNQRVEKIVTRNHKHMVGWDEILYPDLPKSAVIQSWRGQKSLWEAARQGHQGILSAGYYLDLMFPASYHYAVDPMKIPPPAPNAKEEGEEQPAQPPPGSSADLTPEQQKLILGGEAAMWEEMATGENLDSRLWPRLAAIAERLWSPESITDTAFMYERLAPTNRRLEWLGLTQRTNLDLMRQRLAGGAPYGPLDIFDSILEPVKGYSRHAEKNLNSTPLNSLVDATPPESAAARRFRDGVTTYLNAPHDQREARRLRDALIVWSISTAAVRPLFDSQSLLTPDKPLVDAVANMCRIGQEALSYLESGKTPDDPNWQQASLTTVNRYVNHRVGDLLIQIAPGVQQLVQAVPAHPMQ